MDKLEEIIYDPYWMVAWFTFWFLMMVRSRKQHKKRMAAIHREAMEFESILRERMREHSEKMDARVAKIIAALPPQATSGE